MSHNAFDQYGEPPWRGAPVSPAPQHGRRRNPYAPDGQADSGRQGPPRQRLMMDEPPSVEAPTLWPPVPEPSPPRMGAGLRPYSEPATEEAPALRPQSRFREPSTSENLTVGQRPPSPYREYATGETATVRPNSAPPSQRHPSPPPSAPPYQRQQGFDAPQRPASAPPYQRQPGFDEPPTSFPPASAPPFQRQAPEPTARFERQSFREPPTGETSAMRPNSAPPFRQDSPPQRPYSAPPMPQSYAGDTATIDRQSFHEPPTAQATTVQPHSAPPFGHDSPPQRPHSAPPMQRPHQGDTAIIDRQPPQFGYESPQRTIQVEPDTGSLTTSQLAPAPADPPWQSRRAAEEDASYISPVRVLGTVGVIVIVIAIAGALIWGLNLYGDQF